MQLGTLYFCFSGHRYRHSPLRKLHAVGSHVHTYFWEVGKILALWSALFFKQSGYAWKIPHFSHWFGHSDFFTIDNCTSPPAPSVPNLQIWFKAIIAIYCLYHMCIGQAQIDLRWDRNRRLWEKQWSESSDTHSSAEEGREKKVFPVRNTFISFCAAEITWRNSLSNTLARLGLTICLGCAHSSSFHLHAWRASWWSWGCSAVVETRDRTDSTRRVTPGQHPKISESQQNKVQKGTNPAKIHLLFQPNRAEPVCSKIQ